MKYLFFAALILSPALSSAAAVVEYDNGYTVTVPNGWEVSVHPKGFNNLPYSESNPAGKKPGWEGWPWYTLWLGLQGCGDGLVISPNSCPEQPEIKLENQCHFEYTAPEPEECLVISPGTECE